MNSKWDTCGLSPTEAEHTDGGQDSGVKRGEHTPDTH